MIQPSEVSTWNDNNTEVDLLLEGADGSCQAINLLDVLKSYEPTTS